jgi:hypothetical protein
MKSVTYPLDEYTVLCRTLCRAMLPTVIQVRGAPPKWRECGNRPTVGGPEDKTGLMSLDLTAKRGN